MKTKSTTVHFVFCLMIDITVHKLPYISTKEHYFKINKTIIVTTFFTMFTIFLTLLCYSVSTKTILKTENKLE